MELEQSVDEQAPKKHRHRKKLLYNSIAQQMEFYFSDSNLSKDRFLSQLIQTDPYVDLSVFLKFNKIHKLTTNTEHIAKALKKSEVLELSEDKTKVRRTTPIKVRENTDDCTIYVEKITADATHEWLTAIFSEFGSVVYVSIPKYRHNKVNKGFAFVEFKMESEARQVLEHFDSIGCKMSSQMSPEELCSIATYDGESKMDDISTRKTNENGETVSKKRQHSNNFEEHDNTKKLKIGEDAATNETMDENTNKMLKKSESVQSNESTVLNESGAENEDGNDDKKKKKTKKTKKKPNFKELGLQILSKYEWKKMRNRYLDMQKKKMKQLKQFLNKRKFSSTRLEDYRQKTGDSLEAHDNPHESKLEFVPGVIVRAQLLEPCTELKKTKIELKSYSDKIKYIDIPLPSGSEEVYLRFTDNDSAKKFCTSDFKGETCILEDEEEQSYWHRIREESTNKFKKDRQKQRGRDKLLKRAEKELGKHIRFDNPDC